MDNRLIISTIAMCMLCMFMTSSVDTVDANGSYDDQNLFNFNESRPNQISYRTRLVPSLDGLISSGEWKDSQRAGYSFITNGREILLNFSLENNGNDVYFLFEFNNLSSNEMKINFLLVGDQCQTSGWIFEHNIPSNEGHFTRCYIRYSQENNEYYLLPVQTTLINYGYHYDGKNNSFIVEINIPTAAKYQELLMNFKYNETPSLPHYVCLNISISKIFYPGSDNSSNLNDSEIAGSDSKIKPDSGNLKPQFIDKVELISNWSTWLILLMLTTICSSIYWYGTRFRV